MWLLYTVLHLFFMALVNYSDEYLTHSSSAKESKNMHERIGGVLVASTVLTLIGCVFSYLWVESIWIPHISLVLAMLSSLTLIIVWIGYFYLFQTFSAHQVVPLFGLASVWLLLMELSAGETIDLLSLAGVITLVIGAYLLDSGSFKWQIPSRLLLYMVLISLSWASTLFLWRIAERGGQANSIQIYFWNLLGIFCMTFLLLIIPAYRRGFIRRIKNEKYKFIFHSVLNESLSQTSFLFAVLAVAAAPLATFVSALGGVQSVILLGLLSAFPLEKRNSITLTQTIGIAAIACGIAMLEIY